MSTLFLYSLVIVVGLGLMSRNMSRQRRLLLILCALLLLNSPSLYTLLF